MKQKLVFLLPLMLLIQCSAATVKNEGEYSPEFSPNGNYLAYHSHSAEHFFDIFIKNMVTGVAENITNNKGYDTDASWSPDSRQLIFSSNQSGQWDIYLYDLESKQTTLLITGPAMDNQPIWSPDGRKIAFLSRRAGTSQIYLYDRHNKRQTKLSNTEYSIFHPSWSDDGDTIIFDQSVDGKGIIYQLNVKTGQSKKLFEAKGSSISAELHHDKLFVTTKRASSWDIIEFDLKTKKIVDLAATSVDEMKPNIDLLTNKMVYSKKDSAGIARLHITSIK